MTNQKKVAKTATKKINHTYKTLLGVLPSAMMLRQIAGRKSLRVLNGTPGEKFQIKVAENRLEIIFI